MNFVLGLILAYMLINYITICFRKELFFAIVHVFKEYKTIHEKIFLVLLYGFITIPSLFRSYVARVNKMIELYKLSERLFGNIKISEEQRNKILEGAIKKGFNND